MPSMTPTGMITVGTNVIRTTKLTTEVSIVFPMCQTPLPALSHVRTTHIYLMSGPMLRMFLLKAKSENSLYQESDQDYHS